jgi:hypothetical protein
MSRRHSCWLSGHMGRRPMKNTMALNSWEDDATSFLPFGVEIPRMVLEVDQTAYYALLFSQYGQKADVRNEFERLFFEEVSKARDAIAGGRHSLQAVPKPALIWTQNGPALSTIVFTAPIRRASGSTRSTIESATCLCGIVRLHP